MRTILVPGVAWPKYIPSAGVKLPTNVRNPASLSGQIAAFIANNPGVTSIEVTAKFKNAKKQTVLNCLDRLWRVNRLQGHTVIRDGRRHRQYYPGPKA